MLETPTLSEEASVCGVLCCESAICIEKTRCFFTAIILHVSCSYLGYDCFSVRMYAVALFLSTKNAPNVAEALLLGCINNKAGVSLHRLLQFLPGRMSTGGIFFCGATTLLKWHEKFRFVENRIFFLKKNFFGGKKCSLLQKTGLTD